MLILALKVGVMQGSADDIVPAEDTTVVNSALLSDRPILKPAVKLTHKVEITAYSSQVDQTDSTPFITASGARVRDGIVAANWLPLGTKVRIPALFGSKIFIVEDRMAKKNDGKLDIWFASTSAALHFGVQHAQIEVLPDETDLIGELALNTK